MAALVAGQASVGATGRPFVSARDCEEHQAFIVGDAAAVAARLPARHVPVRDAVSRRPLLFARAIRCREIAVGTDVGPATMASFGVVIRSPDGRGCASGAPVVGGVKGDLPPLCNWYTLFWLANDRAMVRWLRGGGQDFPAFYVPGLRFHLDPFDAARGGEALHFAAPSPAPSPFTMDDVARERPGALAVRGGYWADGRRGTTKIAFSTADLTSGDATGEVRAAPGSEMATVMGASSRPFLPGYSVIAAERWGRASYRRQRVGRPTHGQTTSSFEGSCSVQGTSTFAPPISNSEQILAYDYRAAGTCSGVLDGRRVADAPVEMHNAGMAAASCVRGGTLDPGASTLAFRDGPTLRATLDFSFVGSEGDLEWYGERFGTARGHGTFLTTRSPPDVTLRCALGGNAALPLDVSLTAEEPLTSPSA